MTSPPDAERAQLEVALAGQYQIERELGRGGMATVYLARDLQHDRRRVALKVLEADMGPELGAERFRREIRTAARLQHPNVLSVFDSGDAAGRLWFTMPYVEGESLHERLRRERRLSVADAVRITADAADGLHCAHQHGVVHRDVKPENILLTRDGTTLVADFGIARAIRAFTDGRASGSEQRLSGATDEMRLTGTGLAIGTPAYMSPEQAAGDRDVDVRSDIYSLGAVLYEMLAGETPFTGPTAQAVLAKRMLAPAPPIRMTRPSVPAAVEAVLSRALAMAPADRYATAEEFAHALRASLTPPVSRDPPPTVAVPRGQRTAFLIALAVLLFIALFLLIAGR